MAQEIDHFPVPGLGSFFAVHDQQQEVGFGHRDLGLGAHQFPQGLLTPHQAAGIHQQEGMVLPIHPAVEAVPGHPGEIRHQGLGGAGEAVEEGGFAHVGPADDGYQGQGLRPCLWAFFVFRFSFSVKRIGHGSH